MQYREFGKTGKKLSAIGMGSIRFPEENLKSEDGLERCANLVVRAAELGVNYFDIAHNYAKSQCETIYKKAFHRIKTPVFTTAKSFSMTDTDADAVLRRVYSSLEHMEIEKIHFFYMWSIMNRKQYAEIMRKGGPYEGALRAKQEGLIDHIIFSSHASPEETIEMMEGGAYDGGLISYSLLNFMPMQKVLDAAEKNGLGLLVMNPLAGGLIPQNPEFFREIFGIKENVTDFAMKFIYAHQPITCVLSGVSKESELMANIKAMEGLERSSTDYVKAVSFGLTKSSGFCTGCGYCVEKCPRQIKISTYMQAYNMKLLSFQKDTQECSGTITDSEMAVLKKTSQALPESEKNSCIRCGRCELVCTQHLPIISRLDEVWQMAKQAGLSMQAHKERLEALLQGKGYQKVVFYTSGNYTAYVVEEYKRYFGDPTFELFIADSDERKWGNWLEGYITVSPQQMAELKPDCVLVTSYKFGEIIAQDLKRKYPQLNVVKLHKDTDAPWVF